MFVSYLEHFLDHYHQETFDYFHPAALLQLRLAWRHQWDSGIQSTFRHHLHPSRFLLLRIKVPSERCLSMLYFKIKGNLFTFDKKEIILPFYTFYRITRNLMISRSYAWNNYLGGTRAPFIFDWEIWDSWPNTKAECPNPDSCKYRYTRKFNSSVVYDIVTRSGYNFVLVYL